jgi:hypothetical protein
VSSRCCGTNWPIYVTAWTTWSAAPGRRTGAIEATIPAASQPEGEAHEQAIPYRGQSGDDFEADRMSDVEALKFLMWVSVDAWHAVDSPLPDGFDIDDLRDLRDTVYAIIHALDGTLDDNLPFIGRLAEIDRRDAAGRGPR